MKIKQQPLYSFYKSMFLFLFIGIGLIVSFIIIFFILAFKTDRLDFYSIFFHNIQSHIFLTILGSFHVSLLGSGILILIINYYTATPKINCYEDKFELIMFMQRIKTIPYNAVTSINAKIYYLNYDNFFKKNSKKECRIYFNNTIHDFYFYYPVIGYFDKVEIFLKKDKQLDIDKRCLADKKDIMEILNIIKTKYNKSIPYLPDQISN